MALYSSSYVVTVSPELKVQELPMTSRISQKKAFMTSRTKDTVGFDGLQNQR